MKKRRTSDDFCVEYVEYSPETGEEIKHLWEYFYKDNMDPYHSFFFSPFREPVCKYGPDFDRNKVWNKHYYRSFNNGNGYAPSKMNLETFEITF